MISQAGVIADYELVKLRLSIRKGTTSEPGRLTRPAIPNRTNTPVVTHPVLCETSDFW